ncbi:MAG TPA: HAD family hydrolase [Gemmatimonadaceae bacterium]|nr:HAD family hydrolase [Gemmatimonadaceae bacterium]
MPPRRSSAPPRAVLLDVDGTLVDSNDAHARAWVETFDEFGYDIPFERVRPLIGMGGDKLIPAVLGISADSDEGKRLSERRGKIFRERHLPTVRPFPQASTLLERMMREGLTLVIATSAKGEELTGLLRAGGLEGMFDDAVTNSDVDGSKPDPDVIQAALERAKCQPSEAVMLGDTPYDVEAALKAGVRVVGVRSGGWGDADLGGASAIYDDAADLLAHYEESPLGPRGVTLADAPPQRGGGSKRGEEAKRAPRAAAPPESRGL